MYKFSEIKLTDIEGNKVKDDGLSKVLGNAIYTTTKDLGMLEIAQQIYKGEGVELDDEQKEEIKNIVQQNFAAFAQKPIIEYLDK